MRRILLVALGLLVVGLISIPVAVAEAQSSNFATEANAPTYVTLAPLPSASADSLLGSSQSCDDATNAAKKAKTAMFDTWSRAAARGKELGLSDAQIAEGESLVVQDLSMADRQTRLIDLFQKAGVTPTPGDLGLVYQVIDARTAWDEAVVNKNAPCGTAPSALTESPYSGQVQVQAPDIAPNTGGGPLG